MSAVQVRYFAAAREAAGVEEEAVDVADAATVDDLRALLAERHAPALGPVLAVCSLLVDGTVAHEGDALAGASGVDVLPPFAGG